MSLIHESSPLGRLSKAQASGAGPSLPVWVYLAMALLILWFLHPLWFYPDETLELVGIAIAMVRDSGVCQ